MRCSVAEWRRWNDLHRWRQSNENQEMTTDDWLEPTGSNAFPDIYAFSLRIPDATLCVEIPVNVDLPDACGITDNSGHR